MRVAPERAFLRRHAAASKATCRGRAARGWLVLLFAALGCLSVKAVERFPPPDFSDHALPLFQHVPPRAAWLSGLDCVSLAVCLIVAVWLAVHRRSRRGIAWLSVFSVAYFGFYRKGCVCAVGSVQNVAVALCDRGYALPLSVIVFFTLPLLFALWRGRVFCAGVCPLGSLQDLVLFRPVRVPETLGRALGLVPWLYLGVAILCAAAGSGFLICRYDPFVPLFRRSGSLGMLAFGGVLLASCSVVGRAYCRFLCPYGALLGLFSKAAKRVTSITPDECIRCGLCRDVCPFGSIRGPSAGKAERVTRPVLVVLLLVLPAVGLGLGVLGGPLFARGHRDVELSMLVSEASDASSDSAIALEVETFRSMGLSVEELKTRARAAVRQFRLGGGLFGLFAGLVVGLKLCASLRASVREDYEADPAECVACGRCFKYCPREHVRLREAGLMPADGSDGAMG